MKKYTLFLLILAFGFGLFNINVKSVGAEPVTGVTMVDGCLFADYKVEAESRCLMLCDNVWADWQGPCFSSIAGGAGGSAKSAYSMAGKRLLSTLDGKIISSSVSRKFSEDLQKNNANVTNVINSLKNYQQSPIAQALRKGSVGIAVSELQKSLSAAGYNVGNADGRFGPMTQAAVMTFQNKTGLKADGVFGPKSITAFTILEKNNSLQNIMAPMTVSSVADETQNDPPALEVEYECRGFLLTAAGMCVTGTICISEDELDFYFEGNIWILDPSACAQQAVLNPDTNSGSGLVTKNIVLDALKKGKAKIFSKINATPFPASVSTPTSIPLPTSASMPAPISTTTPTSILNLAVVSPNGGETWAKGTTQTIQWRDSKYYAGTYDIKLVMQCTGTSPSPCASPYTIANNVPGYSHSWSVGKTYDNYIVPDGSYKIQVCQTAGAMFCDTSNNYFRVLNNITAQTTITSLSPSSGPVGTQVTITGFGFSPNQNMISFGAGSGSNNYVNSPDGKTIVFTVPTYSSVNGTPIQPGVYGVRVTTPNGASNIINFTVTSVSTPTVTISPTSYTTNSNAGSMTSAFAVTTSSSNTAWTVVDNQPWLTLNKAGGIGNSTVGFSFQANPLMTSRTATITVRAENQTATYTFTQNGTAVIAPPNTAA